MAKTTYNLMNQSKLKLMHVADPKCAKTGANETREFF